jgi:hypothetical protein
MAKYSKSGKVGIIEEVPEDERISPKNPVYYMPHHPVVREHHSTT